MLRVYDNSLEASTSFIRKDLGTQDRYEIALSYNIIPSFDVNREIIISIFRTSDRSPAAAIILDRNFTFKLRSWHYVTRFLSSNKVFAGHYLFPKSHKNYYPSFWDLASGDTSFYPGYTQPQDNVVLSSRAGTFSVELIVNNSHTQIAEAQLYVERINGSNGYSYGGPFFWKFQNIGFVDIGCIHSWNTPYDLTFDNISINGDMPDLDWYHIKDYQGFETEIPEEDGSWIGAGDIDDISTYSELTNLKNLARYNYSKFVTGNTNLWGSNKTFNELRNIYFNNNVYWGSKQTFNELKNRHFIPFTTVTNPPKGLKWYLQ